MRRNTISKRNENNAINKVREETWEKTTVYVKNDKHNQRGCARPHVHVLHQDTKICASSMK